MVLIGFDVTFVPFSPSYLETDWLLNLGADPVAGSQPGPFANFFFRSTDVLVVQDKI